MGPKKYPIDEISRLFDEKLEEFKIDLLSQLKNEVMEEVKAAIQERNNKIVELESTVKMLQKHVTNLKEVCNSKIQDNDSKIDQLEQYGRRQCLRIEGVPFKKEEDSDVVLSKVKELIVESGIEVPDACLDRAHRIGKPYFDSKDKKYQSIIVKFSTFRHRTLLYKNRKKIKSGARVKLDLTRKNYNLLKSANELVLTSEEFLYAFADINCRLKLRASDNTERVFDSILELQNILGLSQTE